MEVTAILAKFTTDLHYEKIPRKAVETAKIALRDCLGVALAGSREEDARIAAEIARQERAREETSVIGQGFRTSALNAALANGTAAHALDFDHSFTIMGQPTAPVAPATFALGEALGASGRQVIEAYVAGFEVTAKLVHSLRDSAHDGWHAPSTLGSFGAAAACSKLLGLDAAKMQMALGITASMASGIVANFGTMTKPLHVGLGARNGVLAAKLAGGGYTANPKAIEGGFGFYSVLHENTEIHEQAIEELGRSYALITDGLRIKPYPCGGLTHQVIDSVLEFRAKHGLTAEMIDRVDVDVVKHTFDRIVFRVPQTGIQGKFCMPYLVARAIIDGKIGLHIFTDSAVRDQNVLKLAERVQMNLDSNLKKSDAAGRPCRVTVRLKNGQTFTREAQHAKGGPEHPMSEAELRDKFTECAREAIDASSAAKVLDYIESLESLSDIRPLCDFIRG
ncbi:MAG TPA: MmgE/PrpD family protein [Candidatus Eisenbacteria bacterium]|nr:MmgE/PrpD family protein [Candidatus Eisenbacteria bacterium]